MSTNISFLPKLVSEFHLYSDIKLLDFYPSPKSDLEKLLHTLNVTRALKFYIHRTQYSNRDLHLFVSYAARTLGWCLSSQCISKWIADLIKICYSLSRVSLPTSISAHSTTVMLASTAFLYGVPPQNICDVAIWKTPSSYIWHYPLDVWVRQRGSLGREVLQSILR